MSSFGAELFAPLGRVFLAQDLGMDRAELAFSLRTPAGNLGADHSADLIDRQTGGESIGDTRHCSQGGIKGGDPCIEGG